MNYSPDTPRKWKRMIFDEDKLKDLDVRERSEIETNRDLEKPVEQLVCDVHEETHNPNRTELQNLASSQKRMVSMMARLSIANDSMTKQMVCLTWVIAFMTLLILILTVIMVVKPC
jgi:hypothetical protein